MMANMEDTPEVSMNDNVEQRADEEVHENAFMELSYRATNKAVLQKPKRLKKSAVWDDFRDAIDPTDNVLKNQCIHCKKFFKKCKTAPTSQLSRHLASCGACQRHKKSVIRDDTRDATDPSDNVLKNQRIHCNNLFEKCKTAPTSQLSRPLADCGACQRPKKSAVWDDFRDAIDPSDNVIKIQCNHCSKFFKKCKSAPTSQLSRHLASCGAHQKARAAKECHGIRKFYVSM